MSDTETMSKLYLELANVLPLATKSSREMGLEKMIASYEKTLREIMDGDYGLATAKARGVISWSEGFRSYLASQYPRD